MSYEDKFNQGALYANMRQLASLMVTAHKLSRIISKQVESDYMFHYGALQVKVERVKLKADIVQKQIEIKCENQSLTKEQTEKLANKVLAKRRAAWVNSAKIMKNAINRLEEPSPSEKDIARCEKYLEEIILKVHPVFSAAPSKNNATVYANALKLFENGKANTLALLNKLTPDAPSVPLEMCAKKNVQIAVKIKEAVKSINVIQENYPFCAAAKILDRKKLAQMQKSLMEKEKKEHNRLCSLEKTLNSLF